MRVIITGGTGLIGRRLGQSLAQDKHEVIVLSRTPGDYAGQLSSGVKAVAWDGKSAEGWGHLADGADAIVNLAGANIAGGRWTKARKQLIIDSRVQAGQAVAAAVRAAQTKPRVVIQASAVGYYGPRNSNILTESASAGDDFLAEVVKQWEPSTAAVEADGVRRVILRIGVVLSDEDGALPKLKMPFDFFVGGPMGSGDQFISWVHIDDVVRAMRFAIERPDMSGAYNVTAPAPVQNRVLAGKLGTVLNRPDLLPVPGIALKLVLGEMATTVLDGQRVVPERLLNAGFRFQFTDVETALWDLLRDGN